MHVHIIRLGTCAAAISTNTNVMVMLTNAFCIFCFRYCDCFANGEFCNNCNCTNCYNNLDHENDRQKAIKVRGLFLCPWDESRLACIFWSYGMGQSGCIMSWSPPTSGKLKSFYCTSKFCSMHSVTDPLGLHWQACLDRNPEAFKPKIGKGKEGESDRRHSKGCNCKRSGCLKNYCECYEVQSIIS